MSSLGDTVILIHLVELPESCGAVSRLLLILADFAPVVLEALQHSHEDRFIPKQRLSAQCYFRKNYGCSEVHFLSCTKPL